MDEDRFQDLKSTIESGFSGINARLDKLNGQVSDHKAQIAVLQDRSNRAEQQATSLNSRASVLGAVMGGAISGVILGFKAWLGVK